MAPPLPLSSRRGGLAAATALALAALSRPGGALAQSGAGGGGGPPDTRKYGLGMRTVLTTPVDGDLSFRFSNERTGAEPKLRWWVFAVGARVPQDRYFRIQTGINAEVLVFDVSTPAGPAKAYRVESGFALDLTWPIGSVPLLYSRPFGPTE